MEWMKKWWVQIGILGNLAAFQTDGSDLTGRSGCFHCASVQCSFGLILIGCALISYFIINGWRSVCCSQHSNGTKSSHYFNSPRKLLCQLYCRYVQCNNKTNLISNATHFNSCSSIIRSPALVFVSLSLLSRFLFLSLMALNRYSFYNIPPSTPFVFSSNSFFPLPSSFIVFLPSYYFILLCVGFLLRSLVPLFSIPLAISVHYFTIPHSL